MSWVCPICSSNNEDGVTKCFVCDYNKKSDAICTLTRTRVNALGLSGDVVIPEKFNVIGEGAFKDRIDITSVTIPATVYEISKEAFCGCANLQHILTLGKLKTIGIRAFSGCVSLTKAQRPFAQYIADDAFSTMPDVIKIEKSTAPASSVVYHEKVVSHPDSGKRILRALSWILLSCLTALAIFALLSIINN